MNLKIARDHGDVRDRPSKVFVMIGVIFTMLVLAPAPTEAETRRGQGPKAIRQRFQTATSHQSAPKFKYTFEKLAIQFLVALLHQKLRVVPQDMSPFYLHIPEIKATWPYVKCCLPVLLKAIHSGLGAAMWLNGTLFEFLSPSGHDHLTSRLQLLVSHQRCHIRSSGWNSGTSVTPMVEWS